MTDVTPCNPMSRPDKVFSQTIFCYNKGHETHLDSGPERHSVGGSR